MKNRSKLSIEKQKCMTYIEVTAEAYFVVFTQRSPSPCEGLFLFFSFNYKRNSQKKTTQAEWNGYFVQR